MENKKTTPEETHFFKLLQKGQVQDALNFAASLCVSEELKGVGLYHLKLAVERLKKAPGFPGLGDT